MLVKCMGMLTGRELQDGQMLPGILVLFPHKPPPFLSSQPAPFLSYPHSHPHMYPPPPPLPRPEKMLQGWMHIYIGMNAIATQREQKQLHDRGSGKHTILGVCVSLRDGDPAELGAGTWRDILGKTEGIGTNNINGFGVFPSIPASELCAFENCPPFSEVKGKEGSST